VVIPTAAAMVAPAVSVDELDGARLRRAAGRRQRGRGDERDGRARQRGRGGHPDRRPPDPALLGHWWILLAITPTTPGGTAATYQQANQAAIAKHQRFALIFSTIGIFPARP
jgi:hypothetical protein